MPVAYTRSSSWNSSVHTSITDLQCCCYPCSACVVTRARSRAVSAVGSVHRPVAGNQCPTGGTVQFLHISQIFSADTAPVRCSNSSKMLQCLLPQPLPRLTLSRWKGSVHRSITDRQCCYCSKDKASTISAAGTALYPNRLPVLLLVRYQRRDSSCSSLYHSAATAPVSLTVLPRSPLLILHQHLLTVTDFQCC